MKKWILSILCLVLLSCPIYAQNKVQKIAGFRWDNPTENVDGTPVDDLAYIRLYHSEVSGEYVFHSDNPETNDVLVTVDQMLEQVEIYMFDTPLSWAENQEHYFVVTASDDAGNESLPSEELVVTFDRTSPNPPLLFQLAPTRMGVGFSVGVRIDYDYEVKTQNSKDD